ncbi:MAG: HAD family hydrolase, partial [Sphingopyxis sp.]
MPPFTTIIFDFGGVITSSPFEAFNVMEAQRALPHNLVRQINAANPDGNAWAQFERADIDAAAFDALFAQEARALGHDLPGRDVIACLSGDVRAAMVAEMDALKAEGYRLACITNNVPAGKGAGMAFDDARAAAVADAMARFDH